MKNEQQVADELHRLFDREDKVSKGRGKTKTFYHCNECSRVIAKEFIRNSVCPKCGLPFKPVKKDGKWTPRFKEVKSDWTLPNGHPDYKFISGRMRGTVPTVNLICTRCHKLFQDTYLLSDIVKYLDRVPRYKGWRNKELFAIKHPYKSKEIEEITEIQNNKCTNGKRHTFRRIHRLITGISSEGKFPPPRAITLDIDFGLSVDINLHDGPTSAIHHGGLTHSDAINLIKSIELQGGTAGIRAEMKYIEAGIIESGLYCVVEVKHEDYTVRVRTIIHEDEYGLLLSEDDKFSFSASTCFIAPPGFEYNPVSEMDDETIDEVIEGMNKKNEQKAKNYIENRFKV